MDLAHARSIVNLEFPPVALNQTTFSSHETVQYYWCSSSSSDDSADSSDSGEATGIDFGSAANDDSSTECSRTFGNITVTVVKDEIANQQVDVIINSTAKNLDLKEGAASRSLLKKGGNSIQQECQSKYSNGITEGEIAITTAGNLQCQQIYHTCLPPWNGGKNKMAAQKLVLKCLQEAANSGHTSLAFPALGTGNLNYDKDYVAKTMFAGVEKFSLNNPSSSVTDVKFVIFPSDYATLQAFKVAVNKKKDTDTSSRTECSVKVKNLTVNLTVGQLHEQQTEVVMTTSTRGLDLKRGTLSNSVLEAAGPALQVECKSKYPKGIQHGEIAILAPANISCKGIYCGALPRYDKPQDGSNPKQLLTTLVTKCLQQASTDGMTSISFPTLGTGFLMYPPKVSASIMLKAISDFSTNNSNSTVKTVTIVLLALSSNIQKNLQPFKSECESCMRKPPPPPVAPKPVRPKSFGCSSSRPIPRPRRKVVTPETSSESPELSSEIFPERGTPEFCIHMYQNDIFPPSNWSVFTPNRKVKDWKVEQKGKPAYTLKTVDQSTFQKIERLVQSTWEPAKIGHGRDAKGLGDLNFKSLKVTKIERIENLTLYEQYCQRRQQLFHKAGEGPMFQQLSSIPGVKHGCSKVETYLDASFKKNLYPEINEGYYFHGTKTDRVQGLLKQGLDPRMAQGGVVLGAAVYMAESSTKADQYTDDRDSRQKTGLQMFLVKASLGKICLMKEVQKLVRPPCCETNCQKADKCDHDNRYDSIVAEEKYIFREFVVYDSHQVYPEYVITYNRV
ncbi:uncharacterized protein LOC123557665 isoform X2 [Mercenaria mercenaria]|uniref:uncharacterized protein LOC123557665 isoform X2 n=1 Tax=Mercenaria mercenaria TaxID=6596 RepID=UPI00234F8EC8|nr:uncharacterized protein LOC123557665 isoform X2 [Mercenaria mercenaria]